VNASDLIVFAALRKETDLQLAVSTFQSIERS
jgi:hypothetical protein